MLHPWKAYRVIPAALFSGILLLSTVNAETVEGGKRITAEELRQCVNLEIDMDLLGEEMKRRKRAMEDADAILRRSGNSLDHKRDRLDRTDDAALAEFNALVNEHNALFDVADASSDAFNLSVDAFNEAVATFNRPCEGVIHTPQQWEIEKHRQMQVRGLRPGPVSN